MAHERGLLKGWFAKLIKPARGRHAAKPAGRHLRKTQEPKETSTAGCRFLSTTGARPSAAGAALRPSRWQSSRCYRLRYSAEPARLNSCTCGGFSLCAPILPDLFLIHGETGGYCPPTPVATILFFPSPQVHRNARRYSVTPIITLSAHFLLLSQTCTWTIPLVTFIASRVS